MAKCADDPTLRKRLADFVQSQGGSQAAAARAMKMQRRQISRVLQNNGRAMAATRQQLEMGLAAAASGGGQTHNLQQTLHEQPVENMAIEIALFIAEAVRLRAAQMPQSGESQ